MRCDRGRNRITLAQLGGALRPTITARRRGTGDPSPFYTPILLTPAPRATAGGLPEYRASHSGGKVAHGGFADAKYGGQELIAPVHLLRFWDVRQR